MALCSGGFQQIQIVLLNVFAPNSAANSTEDHYKTLNTHYHRHTANFGTRSVAISRSTLSSTQPPWTSDHMPIDLTTTSPCLTFWCPYQTPTYTQVLEIIANQLTPQSIHRQKWRKYGVYTRPRAVKTTWMSVPFEVLAAVTMASKILVMWRRAIWYITDFMDTLWTSWNCITCSLRQV